MVFRRRSSRWRRNPGPGRRPIRRAAIRQLRNAHDLMDAGQWSQAAELFERLASAAEDHGLTQAPQLFLRSGRARIENGDRVIGIKHLQHAVHLFGQTGQIHRLYQIRLRLISELKQRGFDRDAVELDSAIHDLLDRSTTAGTHVDPQSSRGHLAVKCPSCGGTLRPDEMEWLDRLSGVCAYCGSVVQTEFQNE